MATIEQCEAQLRATLKSRDDVIQCCDRWGGGYASNEAWSEAEFIESNIKRIVEQAYRKNKLDLLGLRLGFPSDSERERQAMVRTNRRSWIAIGISLAALVVSVVAVCTKD